jgi:hypothetical protein
MCRCVLVENELVDGEIQSRGRNYIIFDQNSHVPTLLQSAIIKFVCAISFESRSKFNCVCKHFSVLTCPYSFYSIATTQFNCYNKVCTLQIYIFPGFRAYGNVEPSFVHPEWATI